MKNLIYSAIIVFLVVGFISCQKTDNFNEEISLEENLKAAVTEIISSDINEIGTQDVQSLSIDKYNGINGAILDDDLKHGGRRHFRIPHLSHCATVTVSDTVYPKEIVVEYAADCSGKYHHGVTGKIVINISDTLTKAGATKTVEFQDFYIDSMKVEFNAGYTNLGQNDEGNWVIETSSEQVIHVSDTLVLKQNREETITWVSGYETTDREDDVFYKSGSGSVSINDSITYSRNITTPLLYDRSCEFILSGVVELFKNGNTVVIDYGDGTCDNIATVTTNGTTEEITLRDHEFGEHGKFRRHCHGFGRRGH